MIVKGAPEYVLPLCDSTYNINNNDFSGFDDDEQTQCITGPCINMAKEGLKTLSYAYKQIDEATLTGWMS